MLVKFQMRYEYTKMRKILDRKIQSNNLFQYDFFLSINKNYSLHIVIL